ncbi:helix-turn-helix transcriptional regulator [Streptomyces sp. TS71-3]|uniref:helix-turn-helix domain-containing protein n=1 Tax=Streptomyces sp. TS71-3 TaxID=2733862 RepID=UPI001AFE28FB|nr:helix-turn-helix transcriptional regulator [Streptomyces sp. TS71-3]GHJ39953.1 transcriptional regulator [Streptomyces sp. TS71-3]
MPPRDYPTARQARLGAELRKMRESAGKTAVDAAALIAADRTRISNIEAGRLGISEERIRRLATFYSCDDAAYVDALCAMSREHRGQFWWDEYRGILAPAFLDIAELEYHATYLRSLQTVTLPGLVQTEDYMRVIFNGATPKLPTEEVEVRTEHRMRRRIIFERDPSTPLEAIIHEAALRMKFGGRKVARAQLEYLLECTERKNITVRVIPFTNETFIETTHPVLYAGGVVPQLDTVRVDSHLGDQFMDLETELRKCRSLFTVAEQVSLDPDDSQQLIRGIVAEA